MPHTLLWDVSPKRTHLSNDNVISKSHTEKVYESLEESSGKVRGATTQDYLKLGLLPHGKQITRVLEKLDSSGLIERRTRKRTYEYKLTEDVASLYLKMDLADHILQCADFILRSPETNTFVWSDEIMSYSITPMRLIDSTWPSTPDFDRDVKEKLEEAIDNFRNLWLLGHQISPEDEKNQPREEMEPRVVVVLDFDPKAQRRTGDTEEPAQATSGRPPTANSRSPMV